MQSDCLQSSTLTLFCLETRRKVLLQASMDIFDSAEATHDGGRKAIGRPRLLASGIFRRSNLDPHAFSQEVSEYSKSTTEEAMATAQISLPLPVLPTGWTAEKDFKALGTLSPPNQRNIEPVGPHFLAHARRVSTLSSCLPSSRNISSTQSLLT